MVQKSNLYGIKGSKSLTSIPSQPVPHSVGKHVLSLLSILPLIHVLFFCQNKQVHVLTFFLCFLTYIKDGVISFYLPACSGDHSISAHRDPFVGCIVFFGWMQHSSVDQSLWKDSLALTNNFPRNILAYVSFGLLSCISRRDS